MDTVRRRAEELDRGLKSLQDRFPFVDDLKGRGMLRGIRIDFGPDQEKLFAEIIPEARNRGLLVLRSGTDVVRIAPPLVISSRDLQRGLKLLAETLSEIENRRNT